MTSADHMKAAQDFWSSCKVARCAIVSVLDFPGAYLLLAGADFHMSRYLACHKHLEWHTLWYPWKCGAKLWKRTASSLGTVWRDNFKKWAKHVLLTLRFGFSPDLCQFCNQSQGLKNDNVSVLRFIRESICEKHRTKKDIVQDYFKIMHEFVTFKNHLCFWHDGDSESGEEDCWVPEPVWRLQHPEEKYYAWCWDVLGMCVSVKDSSTVSISTMHQLTESPYLSQNECFLGSRGRKAQKSWFGQTWGMTRQHGAESNEAMETSREE